MALERKLTLTHAIWVSQSLGKGISLESRRPVAISFEQVLIEVWRQVLVENLDEVKLGEESYPVRQTWKRHLREIDFMFGGREVRGLEQNPETKSRWAQMARSGKKVMQFLGEGRYVANVVDGNVTIYER
ncbi:MAG: hypothetical protein ABSA96_05070 [Candidatus Acidiferrales bacterium]|jgi:hypothetical protein